MIRVIVTALLAAMPGLASADELLESYDAHVLPDQAGWTGGFCDGPCSVSLENGYLVLRWLGGGDLTNYTRFITPSTAPDTFWVEWQFRSNSVLTTSDGCDAKFVVRYKRISDHVSMLGNVVVSADASTAWNLQPGEFNTYRFESLDGVNYSFYVNGELFSVAVGLKEPVAFYLQMLGSGGCSRNTTPDPQVNEWDFVRWGEIGYGEQVVSADPPAGVVNAAAQPGLDRFTVTFDQANYVLVDEITVDVIPFGVRGEGLGANFATGVSQVIATRRLDNGPADTVEIVLDRPLPLDATTTFTFNDGVAINVVEYTYVVLGACCSGGDCAGTGEAECNGTFIPGGACEGDADGDGVDAVCGDGCPGDAAKLEPGQCGCGNPDTDTDEDSVADCVDQCDGEDDTIDEDGDNVPDCLQFTPIPTTTAWGLGIMSLLLLIGAKARTIR